MSRRTGYTPIVVGATTSPKSTSQGTSYPVTCRCVTVMRVPRGIALSISFDGRKDFVSVYGGESFENHDGEGFKSVELLWTAIETTTNIVIFCGDEAIRAKAGDVAAFDPVIPSSNVLYTMTGVAQAVLAAGDRFPFVRIRVPSTSAGAITAVLNAGASEVIAVGSEQTYVVAPGDTLTIVGTAGWTAIVHKPGMGD